MSAQLILDSNGPEWMFEGFALTSPFSGFVASLGNLKKQLATVLCHIRPASLGLIHSTGALCDTKILLSDQLQRHVNEF